MLSGDTPVFAEVGVRSQSRRGVVYLTSAISKRPFKQPTPGISQNDLGAMMLASPAVSGNTLFLRTEKKLYRIE